MDYASLSMCELSSLFRRTLLDEVIPFWLRHGYDREFGGIGNILDDSGNAIGHDKFIWSQGRALWTFSALCNNFGERPQWRDFAGHIFHYLCTHGQLQDGTWNFRLDHSGNVLDGPISIYVDGFVIYGMTEYYRLSVNNRAREIALNTLDSVQRRLSQPRSYKTAPYEIPDGTRAHGVSMIFCHVFYSLALALNDEKLMAQAKDRALDIIEHFYVAENHAIMEYIGDDNRALATALGRTCIPGHALEGLWFALDVFTHYCDERNVHRCCELIKRHLELGWDNEYEGMILALDITGEPSIWPKADCKPWWVQLEAMVASAYAYRLTRDEYFLCWLKRLTGYAYSYYPRAGGEWAQWLDRCGKPTGSAALPVKDPFHLPRALMRLVQATGAC